MAGTGANLSGQGPAPGQNEPSHIAEVVPCIGQQRKRVHTPAIEGFDDDEQQVQPNADGKGAVERRGRVVMVVVSMAMVAVMCVLMLMGVIWWCCMPDIAPQASWIGALHRSCSSPATPTGCSGSQGTMWHRSLSPARMRVICAISPCRRLCNRGSWCQWPRSIC